MGELAYIEREEYLNLTRFTDRFEYFFVENARYLSHVPKFLTGAGILLLDNPMGLSIPLIIGGTISGVCSGLAKKMMEPF